MRSLSDSYQTKMGSESNFIAFIPSFKGEKDSIVLTLDNFGLRWLAAELNDLAEGKLTNVVIGDGKPITSDNRCIVNIHTDNINRAKLSRVDDTTFSLSIVRQAVCDLIEQMDPLLENKPAHQYFDLHHPIWCVVISTGEYRASDLRSMRDGQHSC